MAVVVGNSDYRSERLADLPNAAHDAAALGRVLEQLGFKVLTATNATEASLRGLLAQVLAERPGQALLLFYAGHAVTVDGEALLLPVDAPDPDSAAELAEHGVRLGDAVARLAGPERPLLLFLDACLDGPGGPVSGSPRYATQQSDNVFLAFAAQPGATAADGADRRGSPFSRALLRAISSPGIGIDGLMTRVKTETERLTLGRQRPWSRSTLRRDFFVRGQEGAVRPGG